MRKRYELVAFEKLHAVTRGLPVIAAASLLIGTAPPLAYTDLATPFEHVAIGTQGQPEAARIAAVRSTIDVRLPGVYPAGAATDREIAKALAEFPDQQAGYDRVVHGFPAALTDAVARFRTVFPDFTSPLPIYLVHSLGERDGGSDYVEPGHRLIMFFGADMIEKYHADTSLEPFMQHELFHLEHARYFSNCDQFWCGVWQEGLATAAAAAMTSGATDHQLMLDVPMEIREPVDLRWKEALCFVSTHFDDTDPAVIAQALTVNRKPASGLPARFGYYVGYRLAQATRLTMPILARLDHQSARSLVRATLVRALREADANCAVPARRGIVTNSSPHAV